MERLDKQNSKEFKTELKVNTLQNIYSEKDKEQLKRDTIKRRSYISRVAYNNLKRSSSISLGNSVSALKSHFEAKADSETSKSSANIDKGVIKKQTDYKVNIKKDDKSSINKAEEKQTVVLRKKGPPVAPKPIAKKVSFSSSEEIKPIPSVRQSKNNIEIVKVEVSTIEKEKVIPVIIKEDQNSNYLKSKNDLDRIDYADPEEKHFISRGSSTDSLDFISDTLNSFSMMEAKPKEKKRSNSFKRMLKGSFFGKDKKKEDKKTKKTENAVFADNVQNESFNRSSTVRNTTESDFAKTHAQNKEAQQRIQNQQQQKQQQQQITEVEHRYAEMHVNRFNQIKASFNEPELMRNPGEDYVCMDNGNVKENKVNTSYTNMPNKYIDTSSSSNTLDSENLTFDNAIKDNDSALSSNIETPINSRSKTFSDSSDRYSETPPRAHDTHQNLQLVKPKAIIPINSERPLPNPYHTENMLNTPNGKTIERNLNVGVGKDLPVKSNVNSQNEFSDGVYGTVYERKITRAQNSSPDISKFSPQADSSLNNVRTSPKSPSFDNSKLRLPANRAKVDLQPRLKSPIPPSEISTDKIIATELLKTKKDEKRSSPSHQRLEIDIDYPDGDIKINDFKQNDIYNQQLEANLKAKPPISPQNRALQSLEAAEWHKRQRELAQSPTSPPEHIVNVIVHVDSHSPQNVNANRSITPNSRCTTPVMPRTPSSTSSLQKTPPKHEIRQNVEAFCWKELKKLKEQKDMQLQRQIQLTPFGYAEDPVISHRSRSMVTNASRNSRRSTSLPREIQKQRRMEEADIVRSNQLTRNHSQRSHQSEQLYGQIRGQPIYNPNFVRSSPQRSTVSTNMPGMYEQYSHKPIFKRGSLTNQPNMETQSLYNKKVSFHSPQNPENTSAWPTKNGFTQSPPQRRLDMRPDSLESDVFLPEMPPLREPIYGNNLGKIPMKENEPIYGSKVPVQRELTREETFLLNQQRQKQMLSRKAMSEASYGSRSQVDSESPYATRAQMERESAYATRVQMERESPYATRAQMERECYEMRNMNYGRPLPNEPIYGRHTQNGELTYVNRNQLDRESLYGSRTQIREPIYGSRPMPNIMEREPMYMQNTQNPRQNGTRYDLPPTETRTHMPYGRVPNLREPIYGSRQDQSSIYGSKQSIMMEPIYGRNGQRQSTMSNKVCDIYGKIHDPGNPCLSPPPSQKSGVLYGQLQRNSNAQPMQYQSYNPIQPNNFVRGSRLTASANDMYRRLQPDPRYQQSEPPNRPLPPIPNDSKTKFLQMRRKQMMPTQSMLCEESGVENIYGMQAKNKTIMGK